MALLDALDTDQVARDEWSFEIVEDLFISMRDGVRLAGDLYIPTRDGRIVPGAQYPVVLTRTPYNKGVQNPDQRSPGLYWVQHGYCFFVQDVRGRFRSEGEFYKYTGEAEDGYDTVEWLARQPWCNGNVCTDGPSYLAHVQMSMAVARPPHLKAIFCNKGGFYNAFTSGVRNGGAFEARQWVWAFKNAPRKNATLKKAFEEIDLAAWMARYPFKRGDSPLSIVPSYERFIFDQVEHETYDEFWQQVGFNTDAHLDKFADVPCVFLSGWYDIYARSTIEFFVNLSRTKKGPMVLIMGPWHHVGSEGHIAGEVDFGVQSLIDGNLAPNHYALTRSWFDRFVKNEPMPRKMQPVTYFRMGGGDGHKTSAGCMYHGGMWMYASTWPPKSSTPRNYFLRRRGLSTSQTANDGGNPSTGSGPPSAVEHPPASATATQAPAGPMRRVSVTSPNFPPVNHEPEQPIAEPETPLTPPEGLTAESVSAYQFDPLNPKPTIGGNVFPHKNVLLSGAYDQRERPEHFLCKPPYLPLSSRRDVLVFRTDVLKEDLDVTGHPKVVLYVSSSCVDTDFTAMLIDEYPPSEDYPSGFALNVTHGIQRCRFRNSVTKAELMEPGKMYKVTIEMYPTSNMFRRGHTLRLDISSSNYPHFDVNMNTGEPPSASQRHRVADNSVYHTQAYPSRLVLPINSASPVLKSLIKRGQSLILPDPSASPLRAFDPRMNTPALQADMPNLAI